jgi:hypothetical protein
MKKPSVTQLLDLLAKPALIDWANRQGLAGIDIHEQRRKAKQGGSSLHSQIESYCKGVGKFERELDQWSFDKFMVGKTIIATECKIETEWFVGRYDAKIKVGDNEFIVDYKSGFKGEIYLEHKLQLVAYAMAEQAKIAIVPIPQFHLIPVDLKDEKPYQEMLIALAKIWNLKMEIEK